MTVSTLGGYQIEEGCSIVSLMVSNSELGKFIVELSLCPVHHTDARNIFPSKRKLCSCSRKTKVNIACYLSLLKYVSHSLNSFESFSINNILWEVSSEDRVEIYFILIWKNGRFCFF